MATNNTDTMLQNLSQGNNDGVVNYKPIINGRKIENTCLRFLVDEMRSSGIKDADIVDLLLTIDKGVEDGDLDENSLLKLNK